MQIWKAADVPESISSNYEKSQTLKSVVAAREKKLLFTKKDKKKKKSKVRMIKP